MRTVKYRSTQRAFVPATMLLLSLLCCLAAGASTASAATPAPSWKITTVPEPTLFPSNLGPKGEEHFAACEESINFCDRYNIVVENVGGAASSGTVTITDHLPAGATPKLVQAEPEEGPNFEVAECTQTTETATCTFPESVVPSGFIVMRLTVGVEAAPGVLTNEVSVSGGGAPTVEGSTDTRVSSEGESPTPGVAQSSFDVTGPAGEADTQAGGHPNFVTTSLLFNNIVVDHLEEPIKPVAPVRDLSFYMPLGFLGNPQVASRCPSSLVEARAGLSGCPAASRIGTILPIIAGNVFALTPDSTSEYGIYNIVPEKGYAAEFAFAANTLTFVIYASVVRHDGTYMIRVSVPRVPTAGRLVGFIATFFGDIAEKYSVKANETRTRDLGAFLTNPSYCSSGPIGAGLETDTWERPGEEMTEPLTAFAGLEGCSQLNFSSTVSVKPETTQAEQPSGYEIGLEVPQAPKGSSSLATPPLRDVSLTMPEGVAISPSAANGQLGCQESGSSGINIEGSESEAEQADGLFAPIAGHCPGASILASARATSPLLSEELEGHIYLAQPKCGGAGQSECSSEDATNGKLFGLYLELAAPNSGVVVKLAGKASVDPRTGRVTAEFDEAPQYPISKLVVKLNGGSRAPLTNPQGCGTAQTTSSISSWDGSAAIDPSSAFNVDWDGAGGACPGTLPFTPSFSAGSARTLAGAHTPFTLTIGREDRQQNVASVTATLPPGLLASLPSVTQCPESLASQASGGCPSSSLVGTTTAGVGAGSDPYYVTGKVYFTGPYDGAPFGLSVIVPAVAGPFNLGNVLVRVALFINPHTAQVTAVSSGFPQMLDGVPLRYRTISVTLNAPNFTLNPTNCSQLSVTGTIQSAAGASVGVSSPFAASGCKNLAFKPVITASTEAVATKASGTGVNIKFAYPQSSEANIAKVMMSFPTQLPVRLTTLQKACPNATFEANPGSCSEGSVIGTATVHTPILNQPLVGPVYLVSYANLKFPDVDFVLQGEGVTLDLTGESFISKAGVLTATFNAIPDAPFSTFEVSLPSGPHSQFTRSNLSPQAATTRCGEPLSAPTAIVAQNGATLSQSTAFAITGCKPSKPLVTITKTRVQASSLSLTVKTAAGTGRVRVAGKDLRTLTLKNVKPGSHKLSVELTSAGQKAARSNKAIHAEVTFVVGKQTARKQTAARK